MPLRLKHTGMHFITRYNTEKQGKELQGRKYRDSGGEGITSMHWM